MGILDMSNPLNAIGVGILGNQGNVGRGLLTGVGLYNNQLAANQQRAIREQQIAAAERQAWLQKQQLRAMGRPAAATVPGATLNNGQMFPGIGTAFAPTGTAGQTGWAQYGQQNTTPGTGMQSADPAERLRAEEKFAIYSGQPNALTSLYQSRMPKTHIMSPGSIMTDAQGNVIRSAPFKSPGVGNVEGSIQRWKAHGGGLSYQEYMDKYEKQPLTDKTSEKLSEYMLNQFIKEDQPKAQEGVAGINNIQQARVMVDNGIFSGATGQFQMDMTRVADMFGIAGKDDQEKIARTQVFISRMGSEVGRIIKQFGAGTGLSDADRDYAQKIAGGNIEYSEESMKNLLYIQEKVYRHEIRQFNKKADQIYNRPGSGQIPYDVRIDGNSLPPLPMPEGQLRAMEIESQKRKNKGRLPIVRSQEQYDKLESGSFYMEDGKPNWKP